MKTSSILLLYILIGINVFSQKSEEKKDTTRVNMGQTQIIIINHDDDRDSIDTEDLDDTERKRYMGHWAGLDMGFTTLTNNNLNNNFKDYPYWENDPSKSLTWNWNLMEYKFSFVKHWLGLNTGLGISFTQIALRDNYILQNNADTLIATIDSFTSYSKNKLKAVYLTVPLLLEFCTNEEENRNFHMAAGVIGAVKLDSRVKRKGDNLGQDFTLIEKGSYGLEAFKLDATLRIGFSHWGAFASYNVIPLFDTSKTTKVHPLTIGLSFNY